MIKNKYLCISNTLIYILDVFSLSRSKGSTELADTFQL